MQFKSFSLLIISASLCLSSIAAGQSWPQRYDHDDLDDTGECVAVDKQGNVYVAGTSYGGSTTNYDFFVWKLDTNGDRVWPTTGSYPNYAFDSLGAVRTIATTNEGFSASTGVKTDMAIRQAFSPENRTIAVTGVGSNATGGNAFWWHTVVFEQNSTGSTCSLKSGLAHDLAQTPKGSRPIALGRLSETQG